MKFGMNLMSHLLDRTLDLLTRCPAYYHFANLDYPQFRINSLHRIVIFLNVGDIRGTVVARWTTGQQVEAERSILHQGHDSWQNSSH